MVRFLVVRACYEFLKSLVAILDSVAKWVKVSVDRIPFCDKEFLFV